MGAREVATDLARADSPRASQTCLNDASARPIPNVSYAARFSRHRAGTPHPEKWEREKKAAAEMRKRGGEGVGGGACVSDFPTQKKAPKKLRSGAERAVWTRRPDTDAGAVGAVGRVRFDLPSPPLSAIDWLALGRSRSGTCDLRASGGVCTADVGPHMAEECDL